MKKLIALNKAVFVTEVKETQPIEGELYIPDSIDNDFIFGKVYICPEFYYSNGNKVECNIKPDDIVVFPKICGAKVFLQGKSYIKVSIEDLVAKEI